MTNPSGPDQSDHELTTAVSRLDGELFIHQVEQLRLRDALADAEQSVLAWPRTALYVGAVLVGAVIGLLGVIGVAWWWLLVVGMLVIVAVVVPGRWHFVQGQRAVLDRWRHAMPADGAHPRPEPPSAPGRQG